MLVRDDLGRVLLIRRRDDGTWGLPGGGVEPGETWAACAVRECWEETGWRVELRGLAGVYSDPTTQRHRWYPDGRLVQFLSVVFEAVLVRREHDGDGEAEAVEFHDLTSLPEPVFGPDRPVLADASACMRATPFVR